MGFWWVMILTQRLTCGLLAHGSQHKVAAQLRLACWRCCWGGGRSRGGGLEGVRDFRRVMSGRRCSVAASGWRDPRPATRGLAERKATALAWRNNQACLHARKLLRQGTRRGERGTLEGMP